MASTSVKGITSSSSSPPPLYMYDVFLSFRGKDTRNNFTSHLYSNLAQRGIDVYMDDRELERGKTIEPALWKAIEESRFSVIIFSRDYASSPWCLDELVKIVQCKKEMGHTVLPVFYYVDPSETYEKAFVDHEHNFKENLEKVQIWKDYLSTVTNLSGWDVRNRVHHFLQDLFDLPISKLYLSTPGASSSTPPSTSSSEGPRRMQNLEELYDTTQVMEDTTLFCFHADSDPLSFNKAVTEKKWIKAMDEEIHAIEKKDTWKLTYPPEKKKAIGVKRVYKTKAKLVDKGYKQREGIERRSVHA